MSSTQSFRSKPSSQLTKRKLTSTERLYLLDAVWLIEGGKLPHAKMTDAAIVLYLIKNFMFIPPGHEAEKLLME